MPLVILIYSTQVFAIGNLLYCYGDPEVWNQNAQDIYNRAVKRLKDRNFEGKTQILAISAYDLGLSFLCMENIPEGVKYLEIASDNSHIQAIYLMALFYETGATFNMGHKPTNSELVKAIHYYNKAEKQIEWADDYPYGVHEDMYFIERREHTSAKVFVNLPLAIYNKFSIELRDHLRRERIFGPMISNYPSKTVQSLFAMQDSADRCLNQPFPASWLRGEMKIRQIQQTQCQAMWDFAIQAIPLETQRLQLAERCYHWSVDNSCEQHEVKAGQLVELFKVMRDQVLSVSLYKTAR